MTDNFTKGSEWRKWDLHVHSPKTFLNNQFNNCSTDDYVNKIVDAGIKVVGLTNYFRFDNSEFNIKNQLEEKGVTVFLNLEIRLAYQNKDDDCCDLHIIFDNLVTENNIKNFLTKLNVDVDGSEKMAQNLTTTDEFSKATIEFNHLLEILDQKSLGLMDKYLLGFMSRGKGNSRTSTNYEKIINNSHFLIHSSDNPNNVTKDRTHWLSENKPLLQSSDSHNLDNIGDKFTWIKANPTFEGLKQIIYEPETRVYIGEKPLILSKVENNKTNYIRSLKIDQSNTNHTGDTWFKNISIPFNKELVAIIGNKGNGKSGIADILGLIGNTHIDKKYFSFLHKDKFLKSKLANKFKAQIVWESEGTSGDIELDAELKKENPESVRFIPQNYFEALTNEIEISKFQYVLENIIFEYIPDSEKLGKANFKKLETYKTESVNTSIQEKKNKIEVINNEIIELEKKKHPDYLKTIIGFIKQKNIEIEEQEKLLQELPTISDPNNNGQDSEQSDIAKYNAELDILTENLKEKEKIRTELTSKVEALKQLKTKIELQKQSLYEFLEIHTEEAERYNLNISEILKIQINYSSIDQKILDYETKLKNINIFLEPTKSIKERSAESDNESIVYKINLLTDKLKVETDKLTGEEKTYQKNKQHKKSINEKIKKLTGDTENPLPESLSFYNKEKAFIATDLKPLLNNLREDRIKKSLEIFKEKNKIIGLYNSFKSSVDDKITQNNDLLEDYDIKIDSSFNLNPGFYNDFLNFINQRKSGCFSGKEEGENKIKLIIEDSGFSDEDNIKILLTNIIGSLEENNTEVSEQVNDNKLQSFYDYVFSLDYLNPKYELKLSEKVLGQLSPGERGALLLIFYLMIDKEEIPLVIDQPEDNLDNESVYNMLSKFIKQAKKKRQIIMVTHNPNLAVGADAEQIIHVSIDKMNKHKFLFISGSIEEPEINKKIVKILEGTKPAFDKRKLKYQEN